VEYRSNTFAVVSRTRRQNLHCGHEQDRNVSSSVAGIRQKVSRNLIEQLTVANERSRETSSISDQSNNDDSRNIGQSNNMTAELRQLQYTVSHLQEFCSTLPQAVTTRVSGNQILLLQLQVVHVFLRLLRASKQ